MGSVLGQRTPLTPDQEHAILRGVEKYYGAKGPLWNSLDLEYDFLGVFISVRKDGVEVGTLWHIFSNVPGIVNLVKRLQS